MIPSSSPSAAANTSPLRRLPAAQQGVALTFDDGPDPEFTPRLLDLLAEAAQPASFFLIASKAVRHPALLRRMLDEGHQIANHGWDHRHPWWQFPASARMQVIRGKRELAELTGVAPRWFRPPYGRLRPCMSKAAHEHDLGIALWSRSAVDWGPLTTEQGIAARLDAIQTGDIVLMHDAPNKHNRPDLTLKVLPAFLAALRHRGIACLTLP